MQEIWKEVVGYEGQYDVSNLGNVRSVDRICWNGKCKHIKRGRTMSLISSHGYKCVGLTKNNIKVFCRVHRLVAMAFIPNPDSKPCINHIDGNRSNNMVSNLEWCTYSENTLHAYHETKTQPNIRRVGRFSLDGVLLKEYNSLNAAAKDLDMNAANLHKALSGVHRTSKKSVWKYL